LGKGATVALHSDMAEELVLMHQGRALYLPGA